LVLSLLCADGNVPVFGKLEDGNASDKAINHRLLSEISGHMHQYGVAADAFVYIADSAMVTEANWAQLGERTLFISRLPATYHEHERVIRAAIEADDWQELGRIAQTAPTKHRPGAYYRLHEGSVTIDGKAYRAVVVHSSAHDQRRLKRLERELEASRTEITQVAKEAEKPTFFCRPDAEAAAARIRTYKEQHGIEKNFGFLKDDQIVNALFLKRPGRIEALGLILLISLLIWRLIERVMRTELEARQATLPGWDNTPTARPTPYMVTWKFKGVLVLCIGGQRQLAKPLTDLQMAFLDALQVPSSCFTQYSRDG